MSIHHRDENVNRIIITPCHVSKDIPYAAQKQGAFHAKELSAAFDAQRGLQYNVA